MDVGELLSYKPDKPNTIRKKRKNEDLLDESHQRKKFLDYENPEKILELAEEEASGEVLDETNLKKMLLQFEKRVYKNQEMRIKFPDLPAKFMESEIELNEIVQEMHVIATVPELYFVLVELNTIQSLLQLLAHDNTDISIAVVDLIQELTDVETLTESEADAGAVVDAFLEGQVIAVLVQNLERLDENVKEESDGVHNTLAIVENILEFKTETSTDAARQGLLAWLLKRVRMKMPFEGNKLYASEILSILLQNSDDIRQIVGETDGIDVLLQQLAAYKKHDPVSKDEVEYMENLFNSLCSSLMLSPNRTKFLRGEGLQLMNLMLREKKLSRNSAIKVLDHATIGLEGEDNCLKFVDILGLRTVFPLFMKTPKESRAGPMPDALEEHITSIIGSLLRNCAGPQRQRLLNKFTENDHEKVERLLELHFKYLEKVRACEEQIEKQKRKLRQENGEVDEEMEELFYLKRLDTGLFTLQLIDYILLEICSTGASSIRQRVMQILNLRGGSVKVIRNVMREYAGNIGNAKDQEQRETEQNRIIQLVDKF